MFGSSSKENLHTRVCEILEIATALHARRPDLQDAFELDDPEGIARYWYWLHRQGLLEMQGDVPREARQRIEHLLAEACRGHADPSEVKQELDRWDLFEEYQDRFLSLFRRR